MKKYFKLLPLALFSFCLIACAAHQDNTKKQASSNESYVQLIVEEDSNTVDEKVSFKKGDTVMDVLKANYKVKEKDGFITEIDGYKQDVKAKKYWFYKINDKMADKSANQLKVKKNDKIEFYLEKMK